MGIYSKQWKPRAHYIKYLVERISGFWVRAYSQLWITPGSLTYLVEGIFGFWVMAYSQLWITPGSLKYLVEGDIWILGNGL